MTSVGPGVCRRCRAEVLLLPTGSGALEAFELGEYPIGEVDEDDRYVVLVHRGVTALPADAPAPATCLRRHRCQPGQQPQIPTESLRYRRPVTATRSDFQTLHRLETVAQLVRSQTLGRLRPHAGSRRYSPIEIPADVARVTRLDPDHCVLCRARLDGPEQLTVATVTGPGSDEPPVPLKVCMPECPERGRRDDAEPAATES